MAVFHHYRDELESLGIDLHPSELHGRLVGYVCAVKDTSGTEQRAALYAGWADGVPSAHLSDLLEASFLHALDNLGEFADFEFSPLIPEDNAPIAERAAALASWCGGFLSGYGEAGRATEDSEDVAEALRDLARIASISDEVPEGEENEADLNEILEFVRISVLLIFAGSSSVKAH